MDLGGSLHCSDADLAPSVYKDSDWGGDTSDHKSNGGVSLLYGWE